MQHNGWYSDSRTVRLDTAVRILGGWAGNIIRVVFLRVYFKLAVHVSCSRCLFQVFNVTLGHRHDYWKDMSPPHLLTWGPVIGVWTLAHVSQKKNKTLDFTVAAVTVRSQVSRFFGGRSV